VGCEFRGDALAKSRILLVDDFEPWRAFIRSALANDSRWDVIAEVSDGLIAIQQAEELQPDLILLDIGLPALNGIEVARQIQKVSPKSKILFVSEHRSIDIAREAIRAGGHGYVIKSQAGNDLLPAIRAVAEGERFASEDLRTDLFADPSVPHYVSAHVGTMNGNVHRHHEVVFFPSDESLIEGFARFAKCALQQGSPVVAVATASHRRGILRRLQEEAVNIESAVEQGLFIEADAIETLASFIEQGAIAVDRLTSVANRLIAQARDAARDQSRIAICGELAPTLLAQGNAEAAIQVEHYFDDIVVQQSIDVLCGYVLGTFSNNRSDRIVERICAEHSAVHMR